MKQTSSAKLGRLRCRTLCHEEVGRRFRTFLRNGKGQTPTALSSGNRQNVFSLHAKDGVVGFSVFQGISASEKVRIYSYRLNPQAHRTVVPKMSCCYLKLFFFCDIIGRGGEMIHGHASVMRRKRQCLLRPFYLKQSIIDCIKYKIAYLYIHTFC